MGLIRRNPAAAFEQPPADAQPQSSTAAAAPTPTPTVAAAPPQQPNPATQTTVHPPIGATQESTTAQATGPASVAQTQMVRRNANAGAVQVQRERITTALDELQGLFPVEYDTFDRLKSGAGVILDSNNNNLGREIAITVLSWQDTYDVSPGSDAPEAKKVVRFSEDGINIKDGGGSVNEYLDALRAGTVDGVKYPNASCKKKLIVVGTLEGAEKDTNLLGHTVQVSLSSQSRKSFDRHRFDITLQAQMGKRASTAGAEKIKITAEPRSSNGNNYTLLICTEDTGV